MPTDRDTLELLRVWKQLDRPSQRALLICARLLDEDPHSILSNRSYRKYLVEHFDLFSIFLQHPPRGRQARKPG